MHVEARIEALQEALARAEERVAQLEAQLGFDLLPPLELGLTTSEARILGVLLKREMATTDNLMAALYRDEGRDEPEPKIVDVFVCKARKKLRPFGVEITTIWGRGYLMPPASKKLIASMLQPDEVAA